MTCNDFLDRLYDDDVRRALRGDSSIPSDMSAHLRECQSCQAAYKAAATDERLLTRALREVPPPNWHATVLRDLSRTPVLRKPWIATINEAVAWGVLAIAAYHVLLNDHSVVGQIVAFGTGSAAALLRPTRTKPVHLLRRSLRWV